MDTLRASRRAAATCLAAMLLGAGASARAAASSADPALPPAAARSGPPQLAEDQPIELDARSSELDYRSNTLLFRTVRIAQGALAVEADEASATGLDFKDSHWVFRGHVRITVPGGFMTSDEAHIAFANNAIATALVTGAPAAFEQRREQRVARGHASRIEYDFGAGTVKLTEDAWLSDGDTEITGRTLVYSLRDQRVLASAAAQGSERVRITITPRKPAATPDAKQKPMTPATGPTVPP